MEEHLEHKIATAIQNEDGQFSFQNKEALWLQINAARFPKRVVPIFWKIAAVFLVFFLFGSVFAGLFYTSQITKEMEQLETSNMEFRNTIDSLRSLEPTIMKEVEYVEKEKTVYVKEVVKPISTTNEELDEIENLRNEIQQITNQYQNEISELTQHVNSLETEKLLAVKNKQAQDSANNKPTFILKPSSPKEEMQNPIRVKAPKMELKFFNNAMKNSKVDANTSILNNK